MFTKKGNNDAASTQVAKAFEARDKKADKKMGVKEGSKKDMAMDAKAMKGAAKKKY